MIGPRSDCLRVSGPHSPRIPVVPPIMTARLSSAESSTTDPGYIPFSNAAAKTNGVIAVPAGRFACNARLILIVLKIAAADERENSAR